MIMLYLKSKLHRARVTYSDINYEGSLGIDENLMKAAGMREYERVEIYNVTNGERFTTYLIKEEPGSGKIGVYGAAAHKAREGDIIIITSYCQTIPGISCCGSAFSTQDGCAINIWIFRIISK